VPRAITLQCWTAMDIPAAAAAPWLVLGLVLGITLVVSVGLAVVLARHRRGRRPGSTGPPGFPPDAAPLPVGAFAEDDLPGFLESPPGSGFDTAAPREGWPALSAAPPPPSGATPAGAASSAAGADRSTAGVLVAMALATLLLVAAAAAVAASRVPTTAPAAAGDGTPAVSPGSGPSAGPAVPLAGSTGAGDLADASVPPGNDGAEAELAFGGVILERHAVGVTATYPVLAVTWDGDRALAHLELPTFNCLRDQAPDDPVAAGCRRSVTEYADLAAGDLAVHREGDRLLVTGTFPTYLRPNGTPPVWTGRRYALLMTVEPERQGSGWRPARGVLELGADRAATVDGEANRIRYGG
jgi:hypothetical protein